MRRTQPHIAMLTMAAALLCISGCGNNNSNPAGSLPAFPLEDISDTANSTRTGDAGGAMPDAPEEKPDAGTLISSAVDMPGLSPEECEIAFPPTGTSGQTGAQSMCEYNTEPRLMRLQNKVCALYASGVDGSAPIWERVDFSLKCYELTATETNLLIQESPIELLGDGEDDRLDVDGSFAGVATTENGVWFGGSFLDAESLTLSTSKEIGEMGFRQLHFADLVDSEGDLNPDGHPDAIGVGTLEEIEYICNGEPIPYRNTKAFLFPAQDDGTFDSRREIDAGWGDLPINTYGIATLGPGKSGQQVLALPVERDRSHGDAIDDCYEEASRDIPLIGTLSQAPDGTYVLDSMIANESDRVALNMGNPMGFARLPDDSGFLGTFSNMGAPPRQSRSSGGSSTISSAAQLSGFSFVGMDGDVTHRSLLYKGQTFALDYTSMGIDFGGIPFDLAVTERDDGALILVHTNRVGYTYLADVNGLYITALLPDGTQETRVLTSNGKAIGLISYVNEAGQLFFISSSAYSSSAFDRGLPFNPQLQIWHAPGTKDTTPFTSDGYSAFH